MRSLERTLQVLEVLAQAEHSLGLSDISRATKLDGSTILRYLGELIKLSYAASEGGGRRRYRIGPRLARLGGASRTAVLRQVAQPHMQALGEACGEDVTLGILDADSVLYLESWRSTHVLRANIDDGSRAPVHASSLGKAMLAFMPPAEARALVERAGLRPLTARTAKTLEEFEANLQVARSRGYSTDGEEFAPGVVCIGAPIFGALGQVLAALSITAPKPRLTLPELEAKFGALLVETCRAVSADLGFASSADKPA